MMKTHIVLRPSPLVSLKIDTGVLPRVTGAVGVPSGQSYLNWEKKLYLKILVCYYYLEGRADKIRLFYRRQMFYQRQMCRTVLQSVSYRAVVPNMQKTLKSQQLWRRQPSYKNNPNSHLIKDKNKHIKEKMSSPVCHGEGANENSEIPPYIHHSPTRMAIVPSADKTGFCEAD